MVLHVLHGLGVVLGESGHTAGDKVSEVISGAGVAPRIEVRGSLGRSAQTTASLIVAGVVPVDAGLDGVAALDLGHVVADLRRLRQLAEPVLRSRGERLAIGIRTETDGAGALGGIAVSIGHHRSVRIVEEAGHAEANRARVYRGGIAQDDRVEEGRLGEHEFVGQRGAKHVYQVRAVDIGILVGILSGWIGQRPVEVPPDADRVQIVLELMVPGEEQLRSVADIVVAAEAEFPPIHRVIFKVLIVVAAWIGYRIDVRRGHQLQDGRRIRIDGGRGNLARGEKCRAQAGGVHVHIVLESRTEGAQIRGREVPRLHLVRGHEIAQQAAGRMLVHILIGGIEEQLVVILVEMRAGNDHRAAKVAAWIVEAVGRRLDVLAVVVRAVGVKDAIAGIEVSAAMELGATAFADGLEGDRPFREFRAVGRGQNRDFLDLVLVNVGGLRSLVARVEQVRAIRRHGYAAIERGTLGGEVADGSVVAGCRHRALSPLALGETRC